MAGFKSTYCCTTLLGMVNQLHGVADLDYEEFHKTTLNMKYSKMNNTVAIPTGNTFDAEVTELPQLKYFGVGIGGCYVHSNTEGITTTQPYYPLATDQDLYHPIPVRVVPLSSDLVGSERDKYRLREVRTIDGVDYVLYWLKAISYEGTNTVKTKEVALDGSESDFELVVIDTDVNPDVSKYMFPVPNADYTPDVDPGSVLSVNVSMEGTCEIEGAEVLEAINIMYGGDLNFAKLTEIGLYTGVDTSSVGSGVSGNYIESLYTQLAGHRCWNGVDMSDQNALHSENIIFRNGNIVTTAP